MIPRYLLIVNELEKTEHTKKILRSSYQGEFPNTIDRLSK
jgi:hypothetical protein